LVNTNIDPQERYLLSAKRSPTSETLPSSIIGAGDVASGLRAPKINDISEISTKKAAKSTADRSFIKISLSILCRRFSSPQVYGLPRSFDGFLANTRATDMPIVHGGKAAKDAAFIDLWQTFLPEDRT
jgi:hypothetical protein